MFFCNVYTFSLLAKSGSYSRMTLYLGLLVYSNDLCVYFEPYRDFFELLLQWLLKSDVVLPSALLVFAQNCFGCLGPFVLPDEF